MTIYDVTLRDGEQYPDLVFNKIVEVLAKLASRHKKPILCGAAGGPYTRKISRRIEAVGVPVFHSVRDWLAAALAEAGMHIGAPGLETKDR